MNNRMTQADAAEYADWIYEIRQQQRLTRHTRSAHVRHRIAETLTHALGLGSTR